MPRVWEELTFVDTLSLGNDFWFLNLDVESAIQRLKSANKKFKVIITSPPYFGARSYLPDNHPLKAFEIGTEKTDTEYLDKMLDIIKGLWDLLEDDGILYFNIADVFDKKGSLMLIPQQLQVRMRKELGYIMRNTLIWKKPNPRPEGAQGRFPVSYEFIFYATKGKAKFYDGNIRVPLKPITVNRYKYPVGSLNPMGKGINSRNSTDYVQLDEWDLDEGLVDSGIAFGGNKYNPNNSNGIYSQKNWKPAKDGKTKIKDCFEISATSFYNKEYCPHCDTLRAKKEIWFECETCHHRFNKISPSELAKAAGLDPDGICDVCNRSWKRHFSPNSRDRAKGINSQMILCGGKSVNVPRNLKGCPACGEPKKKALICRACNNKVHSHYAMFPERLIEMLMKSATTEGDWVYDPFGGFGTVQSVAARLGRRAVMSDIDKLNISMAYWRTKEAIAGKESNKSM